jgi:RNA polymerase sigma factor (sigma-70 family)
MFVQEKVMASAVPELPVLARDQAFEILYRRYVKDVYHYALALLRNPADAEDVTQTTFLNAYRAYQQGIEIEKPHNWLIKICHNVARTRYARASRRVKEVPLEDHVEQLAVPEADQPDVVGVLRALGRLPFNQRAALAMRELEGRSYAEIADTIGVSVPAVETLIFRARRTLRLRASSLRSLAAVPLPTSLTRLFEGGGVVAGGGAAAGTGLVIKAAVAVVAAVVGTGVGGDRSRPATAATPWGTGFVLAPSNKGAEHGLKTQQVRNEVRVRESATSKGSRATGATGATTVGVGGVTAVGSGSAQASAGQAALTNQVSSNQVSGTQAGPVSQVTAPVSDLTSTVQQVVEASTAALPVQPPSLPTPPIDVPPVPEVPLPPPPVPLP